MKIDIVAAWYRGAAWLWLLRPLSWLFGYMAKRRKRSLLAAQKTLPVPVVVVGNITVGGTGKTPVVAAIAGYLIKQGKAPVIISRGYGGLASDESYPLPVLSTSCPMMVGDEPVMLAIAAACPVIVDPNRVRAAEFALANYSCDVIISDDGMQHYALPRDFEIAVVDSLRGFGNQKLLPEGPLREPIERLTDVDAVLVNGASELPELSLYYQFDLVAVEFVNIETGQKIPVNDWQFNPKDRAIAGIGNPQRFEATLASIGVPVSVIGLPDHHPISQADIPDSPRVLMTQKDAVKCREFHDERLWYLRVKADLPRFLYESLLVAITPP